MDNYKQEIAENLDKYLIDLDETFRFKCFGCGKCCKNRDDIILNTRDLFNIAKKLGLTTEQAISKYCNVYIGGASRIPVVRLSPRGENMVCPLLQDNRCMVHDLKPSVCALFPAGRVAMGSVPSDGLNLGEPVKIGYVLNKITCGSAGRTNTIRSWLTKFGIPIEDEFFIRWNEAVIFLSMSMRELEEKKISGTMRQALWNAVYSTLYLVYDTQKEFLPQFEMNMSKIEDVFARISGKPKIPKGDESDGK